MPSITDADPLADNENACEYLIGHDGLAFRSAFEMPNELKDIFARASSAQFFFPSNENWVNVSKELSEEGFTQEKSSKEGMPNTYTVRPWLNIHSKVPNHQQLKQLRTLMSSLLYTKDVEVRHMIYAAMRKPVTFSFFSALHYSVEL